MLKGNARLNIRNGRRFRQAEVFHVEHPALVASQLSLIVAESANWPGARGVFSTGCRLRTVAAPARTPVTLRLPTASTNLARSRLILISIVAEVRICDLTTGGPCAASAREARTTTATTRVHLAQFGK